MQKFESNAAISSVSVLDKDKKAIIAGREVLGIVDLRNMKDFVNFRIGTKMNMNNKRIFVTASPNGAIVLWDADRIKQEKMISEHKRSINKLHASQFESATFLSASQDGLVKLWDLRSKLSSKLTFNGKADAVRDVKYHPFSAYEFIAAFENGTIQVWDIRNPMIPEKKITCHNGVTLSVDWHKDGRWIVSGGRDKIVKVWDIKGDLKKPIYSFQNISSVSNVSWRPDFNQIASTSLLTDYRVHVWDITHSYVPSMTFENHSNVITCIKWLDSNNLISVSRDKTVCSQNIQNSYELMKTFNKTCSTFGLDDQVYGSVEKFEESTNDKTICETPTGKVPIGASIIYRKLSRINNASKSSINIPVTIIVFDSVADVSENAILCEKLGLFELFQFWTTLQFILENSAVNT
ncbi:WD40 repeat-like protein [Rozella allomycis CSF55]|uniref:WD40 repeat-like protein n=1 Tax=Rozella allomycis (strain CSF55) TaxID=988480 RepID=A0A075AWD3_ROZAC|nr:hypothetical protein O9G_002045 [Rozella allomycis CSF55]RKP20556.1 WD40 repeat-like protein [Rozella allomycis CSF55]|eukprot:EPZ34472.1 hypothetical protein O9G_002045 [Rozella allomycis CSF55]